MRTLTNNLPKQIEDFLLRWKVVPNYALCGAVSGEKLTVKVRPEMRIRQLNPTDTPAFVTCDTIYVSKERVMEQSSSKLIAFVLAHEVGHWVYEHLGSVDKIDMLTYKEVEADNFALSIYQDRETIQIVGMEFLDMYKRVTKLVDEAIDTDEADKAFVKLRMATSRLKNVQRLGFTVKDVK